MGTIFLVIYVPLPYPGFLQQIHHGGVNGYCRSGHLAAKSIAEALLAQYRVRVVLINDF